MYLEDITRKAPARMPIRHAVLDFDGTLSLIREGWQGIMIPYFADEMTRTPVGAREGYEAMERRARDFIFRLTGKQTIYQCIELAHQVEALGGKPLDAQACKDEYHRRLLERIDWRLHGLESGALAPEALTVPGSAELLQMLQNHGVRLYLASGTDEVYVLKEARLLGLDAFFEGRIYGAQREYQTFSKKMVIERILRENDLNGEALLGFGDGYVEIENVKEAGGYAVGVASDERNRAGVDEWKRERLITAGADVIIPDYSDLAALEKHLFGE